MQLQIFYLEYIESQYVDYAPKVSIIHERKKVTLE